MNSIKKGKAYECEIANLLSKATGAKWQRVPCSGATATAQDITDHRFRGDVFTEDERFSKLVVECKAVKGMIRLEDLENPKSLFWSWVKQAEDEAGSLNWVLIFKANYGSVFVVASLIYPFPQIYPIACLNHPLENKDYLLGVFRCPAQKSI